MKIHSAIDWQKSFVNHLHDKKTGIQNIQRILKTQRKEGKQPN